MSIPISHSCDIAIIGAGPAGAVAAAILVAKGYHVVVLERQEFPRFSIGESLLPQCMEVLDEAGMMDDVVSAQFQLKNGAAFDRAGSAVSFDFSEKFTSGYSTAFEVQRDRFDKILADRAVRSGAEIHYLCEIVGFDQVSERLILRYKMPDGSSAQLSARFCLDASGFGQTLAKLQDLVRPANWPIRESIFTHIIDHIDPDVFDRTKILITVHPSQHDIWFWLIPFSDASSSLGVVAPEGALARFGGCEKTILQGVVSETELLASLLANADYHKPCARVTAYASEVEKLYGEKYALLGNAGGFLDPVFSSGVTIALKSASLAADCLDRSFRGQTISWEQEFSLPLKRGVETFRQFVGAWYDGRLQDIIFAEGHNDQIRRMICSILAGYAWDENNPFVAKPGRRLSALAEMCK